MVEKQIVTSKVIEKDGFHRRVRTWSYAVVLTEIGGSRVKVIRLDEQTSMAEAQKTALADNPGWRFKGLFTLGDRDFEGERKDEKESNR